MHGACGFGSPGFAGFLKDGKSIHIRPKTDGAIAWNIASDDADHARAAKTGHDFVNAERFQLVRNESCGVVDIIQNLGIFMQVTPPFADFLLKFGGSVQNRHSFIPGFIGAAWRKSLSSAVDSAPHN
jgi:hypothetical protein